MKVNPCANIGYMSVEKEQDEVNRHRSLKDPVWFLIEHELGPYQQILAGNKPPGTHTEDIPIDVLKADVCDQLTLLLAAQEMFGKNVKYQKVLKNIETVREYRNKHQEELEKILEMLAH